MSYYLFLAACVSSAVYGIEEEVKNVVNQVTTTKDGSVYCPVPLVGTPCGASSVFHYWKCCGDFNKECCFALQTWVIVVIAIVAVIVIASFIISVVRCIFCKN